MALNSDWYDKALRGALNALDEGPLRVRLFTGEEVKGQEVPPPAEPTSVVKWGQSIEISDQDAHDYGLCTCRPGDTCTYEPPPPPPLPPRRQRARYWLRRRWWGVKRLPGYRLVHKDDLPDPADWPY